ncbi:MAG TPA: GNAT family N-acetyltransferase [Anaerolineales bacterium]|nr:GNAT family N-acetyltransferase [Anaerolineales bacterium]
MISVRQLTVDDLPRLRAIWKENWGDEFVVAHGVVYYPDSLDGFIALDGNEWIGEITYTFSGNECEIVSLDSMRERTGIGTMLIHKAIEEARKKDCRRIFLITTNDNLNALGFYQKRGFELVAVHRGALDKSRKIKPGIPLMGANNIPLRDEIELEMLL